MTDHKADTAVKLVTAVMLEKQVVLATALAAIFANCADAECVTCNRAAEMALAALKLQKENLP